MQIDSTLTLNEGHAIAITVNGLTVLVEHRTDPDSVHFVELHGVDCRLAGEMPGMYYPEELTPDEQEIAALYIEVRKIEGILNIYTAEDLLQALNERNGALVREMLHGEADLHSASGNAGRAETFRNFADRTEDF